MFLRLAFVLLKIFVSAFAGETQADERVGAFIVLDDIPDAIILDGEIGVSTPLDFRRALKMHPNTSIVVLASPGGLVASALIVADDIHKMGLSTFIPDTLGCYSACAFVFFAGVNRLATGELGVHQMASDVPDPSGVQYSTADILDALEDFEVPTAVLSRMFRTPNSSMYVFSPEEVATLGINRQASVINFPAVPKVSEVPSPSPTPDRREPEKSPVAGKKVALYTGLDFYGSDLQSSRMPDAVQCATACLEHRYCQAFTFNANPSIKKGPNCFLKASTERPEAYQDAISGLFFSDGDAPQFSVDAIDPTVDVAKGVDFPGGDLLSKPLQDARTPGECRQACIGLATCVGYSFANKPKQCWLKGALSAPKASPNVTSGAKRLVTFAPSEVIDLDQ